MKTEIITLSKERDVTLTAYVQEAGGEFFFEKRPAMLVLPGGGYLYCSDREADPVAMAYLQAGYQVFILRYTLTPKGKWPLPLEDYEAAMELICANAERWYVDTDRIAAIGFSAGGHLCACSATLSRHKPAAAVIVYPAILKYLCDMCQPGMPYPHEHVTRQTSPCFLVAARDDRVAKIQNTLVFAQVLAENDVPFETHIYAFGGHGFTTGERWLNDVDLCSRVPDWVPGSIAWLKDVMGELTVKGMTEQNPNVLINGDDKPWLSVSCSMRHIRMQPETVQEILQPVYAAARENAARKEMNLAALLSVLDELTLSEFMHVNGMSREEISKVNQALSKIANSRA